MANDLAPGQRSGGVTPRQIFLPVFITVAVLVILTSAAITWNLPEMYASTARIMVDAPELDACTSEARCEQIKSEPVLASVINRLNLNVSWGKRYDNGQILTPAETLKMLKQRISLKTIRNTDYITITAYSEDSGEAAQIANAIATAYNEYLLPRRVELYAKAVKSLENTYRQIEKRIQSLQIEADALQQTLNNKPAASLTAYRQAYADKKRVLATAVEFQNIFAKRLKQVKIDAMAPQNNRPIILVDPAKPNRVLVRPNKTLNIVIGAVAGIFLGTIAGGVAMLINQQLKKRLGIRLAKP